MESADDSGTDQAADDVEVEPGYAMGEVGLDRPVRSCVVTSATSRHPRCTTRLRRLERASNHRSERARAIPNAQASF